MMDLLVEQLVVPLQDVYFVVEAGDPLVVAIYCDAVSQTPQKSLPSGPSSLSGVSEVSLG